VWCVALAGRWSTRRTGVGIYFECSCQVRLALHMGVRLRRQCRSDVGTGTWTRVCGGRRSVGNRRRDEARGRTLGDDGTVPRFVLFDFVGGGEHTAIRVGADVPVERIRANAKAAVSSDLVLLPISVSGVRPATIHRDLAGTGTISPRGGGIAFAEADFYSLFDKNLPRSNRVCISQQFAIGFGGEIFALRRPKGELLAFNFLEFPPNFRLHRYRLDIGDGLIRPYLRLVATVKLEANLSIGVCNKILSIGCSKKDWNRHTSSSE
jgi:hypothetical protein